MTANLLETEGFDGFSSIVTNTVELTDHSLKWASQVAHAISESSVENFGQWQAFLEAMALAGFRQWLDDGALPFSSEYLSNRSQHANLQVGDYRLHVAALNTVDTRVLTLPVLGGSPVDSLLAHLYVMVDVQEEVDRVQIIAGAWKEQLLQAVEFGEGVRSLSIPLSAFTVEPEQILLCLSCLEPQLAPAASAASNRGSNRASIAGSISASVQSVVGAVGAMTEQVTSDFINAQSWLQDRVDLAVEQMGWALLPPISPAMRPVKETVDVALDALSAQGVQLPLQARGVGGPIALGSHVCQIYAWAWPVEAAVEDVALEPEWSLFLLLGPSVGESLPQGIQLEVSEGEETLTREVLTETSAEAYLFTQVQGAQSEQFVVRVILPERVEIVLPAFSFESVL